MVLSVDGSVSLVRLVLSCAALTAIPTVPSLTASSAPAPVYLYSVLPMYVAPLCSVSSYLVPPNAVPPMLSTLSAPSTVSRLAQLRNARAPIDLTLLGILTLLSVVCPSNAPSAIAVTGLPSYSDGSMTSAGKVCPVLTFIEYAPFDKPKSKYVFAVALLSFHLA